MLPAHKQANIGFARERAGKPRPYDGIYIHPTVCFKGKAKASPSMWLPAVFESGLNDKNNFQEKTQSLQKFLEK